jgi:hypothetical protein
MSMLFDMLNTERLRPQDVVVACKLFAYETRKVRWTYARLSLEVGLSSGEAHNAVDRLRAAQVVGLSGEVARRSLRELLVSAVPLVYYGVRGSVVAGIPTAASAPVLEGAGFTRPQFPTVWRSGEADRGSLVSGESLAPVHESAPTASSGDPLVYELLALVDVLRASPSPKDRALAASRIEKIVMRS